MSKKPLITAEEIQKRIDALAREISDSFDYDVLLSALTGAYMFTADLARALAKAQGEKATGKKVIFIKASSYGNSTVSSGTLQVHGLDRIDPAGKKLLLVDDIADTGNTLLGLSQMLRQKGADVRTCVLLNKQERREVDIRANFVGFEVANEFVVGYGLDYAEKYRMLPEIWTLEETD